MNYRKLKSAIGGVIVSFALLLFVNACNTNDKSKANTSTDTGMANTMTDTSMSKKTVPSRKGRVALSGITERKTAKVKMDKSGVYETAEVQPTYPGGQTSLVDYMTTNIEYPQVAIDNSIEGTLEVEFVVDENGKVSDAKVAGKKLGYGLDEEAIRVVSNMPKWVAGQVKGKNVKARVSLPITFKIE